jgi:predicted O-linked N-acetylglucosamine transferase (SPINDLY family)
VAPPPSAAGKPITFGSFNSLAKVSTATLDLWSAVLQAVPDACLMVKAKGLADEGVRARLIDRLKARGIEPQRVTIRGWEKQHGGQLSVYSDVDIALDTYPYNGGTTTCEALWMGVPVVTQAGTTHASRMGASLLRAAGLAEFVAGSPDEYLRVAVALAREPQRIARLRHGMRERLRRSPLMDEIGFTRDLESLYRDIWRKWCGKCRAS